MGAGWREAAEQIAGNQTWQLTWAPAHIYAFVYKRVDPAIAQEILSSTQRNRPSWFFLGEMPGMKFCQSECAPTGKWLISNLPSPDAEKRISWCGRDVLYVTRLSGD